MATLSDLSCPHFPDRDKLDLKNNLLFPLGLVPAEQTTGSYPDMINFQSSDLRLGLSQRNQRHSSIGLSPRAQNPWTPSTPPTTPTMPTN